MIFLLHVEWPEMPPYKLLVTYYVWRIMWRPWRPFLGHQAWSWTTLRRGNVFLLRLQTFVFIFVTFLTFLNFYLNVFYIYGRRRPAANVGNILLTARRSTRTCTVLTEARHGFVRVDDASCQSGRVAPILVAFPDAVQFARIAEMPARWTTNTNASILVERYSVFAGFINSEVYKLLLHSLTQAGYRF